MVADRVAVGHGDGKAGGEGEIGHLVEPTHAASARFRRHAKGRDRLPEECMRVRENERVRPLGLGRLRPQAARRCPVTLPDVLVNDVHGVG